jgi:hypothetical protein
LRLLLLLHLLLLELTLLHFLHHLLRSTDGTVGAEAGPNGVLRLRRLNGGLRLIFRLLRNVFFLILLLAIHASGRAGGAVLARTEHDLARCSLADISGEKDIVPGALQKL